MKVRGVVVELHNEAGVGTLAAYEDGRARWFGGQGAMTFWESPGTDPRIDAAIQAFLSSAAPVVAQTPAVSRHEPSDPPKDHLRVTVLTHGGLHVSEVYGPSMGPGHLLAPVMMDSTKVLDLLSAKSSGKPGR